MMARRDILRMPSSEPMVPFRRPGNIVPTWMPVSQCLQQQRIIMVGKFIDDQYANQLIAMMLYLAKEDSKKAIKLYFNCPGALIRPAMSIFDTMNNIYCPIETTNIGLATGMVSFLCGAGTRGMRYALPNARFLMQRTGLDDPYQGQASDIANEVGNIAKGNRRMELALSQITGQAFENIHQDLQRDFYLSSAEAVEYGLIDKVVLPKGKRRRDIYKPKSETGGFKELNKREEFGDFEGDKQKYGDVKGGGWGAKKTSRDDDMGPTAA
ncbi:unnamed protein product [Discosporangium mesarthrocarpum]